MNGRNLLVAAAVLLSGVRWVSAADTVILRGGKSLSGLIVDHRSDELAIKLRSSHGEMPVLRSTVERVERDADMEVRYWLAREYFDETAEGMLDLALWCQANKLEDERDEHLNTVLQLDPNHAEARKLLGYVRRGREWVLKEAATDTNDVQGRKEAALAGEASRPDQDRRVNLEQARRRQEILRKQQELNKTVVRLVSWLESKNAEQVQQARAGLTEIRDQLAIGPLTKAMGTANDSNRLRLMQTISQIPSTEASYALAIAAVVDLSNDSRFLAVELLKNRPEQKDRYLPVIAQGLRSEKPGIIYNAAEALTELGQKGAIPRLIDSLQTPVRTNYITGGYNMVSTYPKWVSETKLVDVWTGEPGSVREYPVYCPP